LHQLRLASLLLVLLLEQRCSVQSVLKHQDSMPYLPEKSLPDLQHYQQLRNY
jgi:hypothetical protein